MTRRLLMVAVTALGLTMTAWPAAAQADQDPGRYLMERTAEGIVRLDTVTGEMVLCRPRNGGLACGDGAVSQRAGPDLERRIAALERRIERLDRRLRRLRRQERQESRSAPDHPSEEEFERSMMMMERFMRTFLDIVEESERPTHETPAPQDPDSNKT